MRVLIVEDDVVDEKSLVRALKLILPGAEVTWAKTLADGLVEAAKEPDLILLDLTLPDSSPFSTIAAFAPVMKKTHVVVVTGVEDKTIVFEALESGALGFVLKGNIQGMLCQTITEAMRMP